MTTPPTRPSDVVPLSYRIAGTAVFRVLVTSTLTGLSAQAGRPVRGDDLVVSVAYLVVTGLLSLPVLTRRRTPTVFCFGIALLIDTAYLQYQHHRLGHGLAVDLAVGGFLVAVCLLASFRTALKVAVWQSLLLVVVDESTKSGLIPPPPGGVRGDLVAEVVLTWLIVVTAASAAAVNERELRRRRFDAEALRAFAERLHECDHPDQVCASLVRFVVEELDAARALVCHRAGTVNEVIAGDRLGQGPHTDSRPSALLERCSGPEPLLALRLDHRLDPWLTELLPGRRYLAVRLGADQSHYLVFTHGSSRSSRVERRIVSTVAQACATAALAMSRAQLLAEARLAASTDGLTGAFNRRCFDEELERFMTAHHRSEHPVGLIMVDVDRFKSVNDTYGHQVGDQVLRNVARAVRETVGSAGLAFRYGGEELSVLLPGLDTERTALVAERIRVTLVSLSDPVQVTASFGAASVPADATSGSDLVAMADDALLMAKERGRNRVVRADGGPAPVTDGVPIGLPLAAHGERATAP